MNKTPNSLNGTHLIQLHPDNLAAHNTSSTACNSSSLVFPAKTEKVVVRGLIV